MPLLCRVPCTCALCPGPCAMRPAPCGAVVAVLVQSSGAALSGGDGPPRCGFHLLHSQIKISLCCRGGPTLGCGCQGPRVPTRGERGLPKLVPLAQPSDRVSFCCLWFINNPRQGQGHGRPCPCSCLRLWVPGTWRANQRMPCKGSVCPSPAPLRPVLVCGEHLVQLLRGHRGPPVPVACVPASLCPPPPVVHPWSNSAVPVVHD